MTTQTKMAATLTVDDITLRHTAILRGSERVLASAIRAVRCPHTYDRRRRAFLIPKNRADEVLAAVETGKTPVHIRLAAGW